jgi:hypothetical protein
MCSPLIMEEVRRAIPRRRVIAMVGAAVAAGMTSQLPVGAQEATPVTSGPGNLSLSLGRTRACRT